MFATCSPTASTVDLPVTRVVRPDGRVELVRGEAEAAPGCVLVRGAGGKLYERRLSELPLHYLRFRTRTYLGRYWLKPDGTHGFSVVMLADRDATPYTQVRWDNNAMLAAVREALGRVPPVQD